MGEGDIYILHFSPSNFGNLSENWQFHKNAVLQLVKKAGSAVLRTDHVPNLEERQATRQWTVDQSCPRCTMCGIVAPSKKVHCTALIASWLELEETSEERYELRVSRTSDRELGEIVRLPLALLLIPPRASYIYMLDSSI